LWSFHCGTKKHKEVSFFHYIHTNAQSVEQLKIRASAPKEVPKPAPIAKPAPTTTLAPAVTTVIVERKTIPKRDREEPISDANKNKKQKGNKMPIFFLIIFSEEEPQVDGVPSDFFDSGFVPEPVVEEEIIRAPVKMNDVPIGEVENLPRGTISE
jgi:hypothetical protein